MRDLTASEFGGYNFVVTLHGEGSMQAQLLQTVRDYPLAESIDTVRSILSGDTARLASR